MHLPRLGALILACFLVPTLLGAQVTRDFNVNLRFGENTEPPTVPTNVIAIPVSASQIDVNWSPAADPFGVGGYQVFRDNIQIATTSLTTFADTGLTASTTYTYFVRAFDIDGLLSSSSVLVATTTFALPLPPIATSTNESGGSFFIPLLQQFSLNSGSDVARFDFQLSQPVSYRIEYSIKGANNGGIIQTDVLRLRHTTVLTNLESNTEYEYVLTVIDRFGRETVVRQGTFITTPRFVVTTPPNAITFTAYAMGTDVLLRWIVPETIAYVRVVRNNRFFPNDPFAGVVVYQGSATAFTDSGALLEYDTQYYTIFTYTTDGIPSSGTVARASRILLPSHGAPVVPPIVTENQVAPEIQLTSADVEIIQDDRLQVLTESVTVRSDSPFLIRVNQTRIPTTAKTLLVSLWQIDDEEAHVFMLRRTTTDYFEAFVPPLSQSGVYDMRLELFDGLNEPFFSLTGLIAVIGSNQTDPVPEVPSEITYLSIVYIILGGLVGMIVTLGLHRLFILVWRRRTNREDISTTKVSE